MCSLLHDSGVVIVSEHVMNTMKELYNIPEERKCRLWHKYMLSTYDLLNKLEEAIQDAGLCTNWVCVYVCVFMCVCVVRVYACVNVDLSACLSVCSKQV